MAGVSHGGTAEIGRHFRLIDGAGPVIRPVVE